MAKNRKRRPRGEPIKAGYCNWLDGQDNFAQVLAQKHNNPRGVFLNQDEAIMMTLEEAVSEAQQGGEDAIFSAEPGKLAFWFSHDTGTIRCWRDRTAD